MDENVSCREGMQLIGRTRLSVRCFFRRRLVARNQAKPLFELFASGADGVRDNADFTTLLQDGLRCGSIAGLKMKAREAHMMRALKRMESDGATLPFNGLGQIASEPFPLRAHFSQAGRPRVEAHRLFQIALGV